MSTISPKSLLTLSIDVVSRNYQSLCIYKNVKDGSTQETRRSLVFRNGESFPSNISEKLLRQLIHVQNNTITSDILSLFCDPAVCHLRRFCIGTGMSRNTDDSYYWEYFMSSILKNQDLAELRLGDLIIDFTVDYRHFTIARSLKHLKLCPCDKSSVNFILTFHNLKHLDVSNTEEIGDEQLRLFVTTLLNLESLNVSSTNVASVEAFGQLRDMLKYLYLYDTPLIWRDLTGLLKFTHLEILDISQKYISGPNKEFDDMLTQFLTATDKLQSLVSLDISGADVISNKALQSFIDSHPKLRFLGLLNVEQTVYSSNGIPEDVEVTGDETSKQLLACLRHYKKRPSFLVKAMRELYRFSSQESHNVQQRKIIVKLLLELMTRYMNEHNKDLQMAASACLFGYVKEDNSSGPNSLHISILSEMVSVIIQVLKTFPIENQIQRNCLLTLYKNYILVNAKFDSFLLSKLILKAISLFPNSNVTAIGLDICAYLCAQITMEETLKLGTNENIERLLSIVDNQINSNTGEILLHCALRVLWNLTDECSKTCQIVVDLNGLQLLMKAMQTLNDKNDVLKKILGILNNLAEVVAIRSFLLREELLSLLRNFLDTSYHIDVSYFACGVISNLIMNWSAELIFNCGTRNDFLSFVGTTVSQWQQPDKAMVGYRSFKPFIPLLLSQFPDVQLWAVWAIHHVCFHRVARYGKICSEEGIIDILKRLSECYETRSDVKKLAIKVRCLVENIMD